MDYYHDRRGSKLVFLAIGILFVYFWFFGFNLEAGYDYFVASNQWFFGPIASWFGGLQL